MIDGICRPAKEDAMYLLPHPTLGVAGHNAFCTEQTRAILLRLAVLLTVIAVSVSAIDRAATRSDAITTNSIVAPGRP